MNKISKQKIATIIVSTLLLTSGLILFPSGIASSVIVVEKGTVTFKAADMPSIIGIPQSNIRFALWNGSFWYELPFAVSSGGIQKNATNAQTNVNSTATVLPAEYHQMKRLQFRFRQWMVKVLRQPHGGILPYTQCFSIEKSSSFQPTMDTLHQYMFITVQQ